MSNETPRTEMKCVRCGGFSSTRICWHCSNLPDAISNSLIESLQRSLAAMTAERDTEREKRRLIEAQHVRLCDEVYEQDGETLRQDSLQAERDGLKERLATVRVETIGECAKVCDPNGMSAEEYCKISNYVIQRDIQRDIALMKNLAEAIRALKEGE